MSRKVVVPGSVSDLLEEIGRITPAAGGSGRPPGGGGPPAGDDESGKEYATGDRVGPYVLGRVLGSGDLGPVFDASDSQLGRRVALRLIRRGVQLRELFAKANPIARLSHPNVAQLFDVGTHRGTAYFVHELLEGEPLSRRLDRGELSLDAAVRMALELARGVAAGHRLGVLHLNLKPSNVFLCKDGQAKVLDFGLALLFTHPRQLERATPERMAPELLRGAPGDESSDVYALGAILLRSLTGRSPRMARGAVPAAPTLEDLLVQMLAVDPSCRPRDAGEVVRALEPEVRRLEAAATGRLPSSGAWASRALLALFPAVGRRRRTVRKRGD